MDRYGHPVEIKANVEQKRIDDALSKLKLKDEGAETRSVHFCENGTTVTPLNEQDTILSIRRNADDTEKSDVTLKLRPCLTEKLPAEWSAPSEGEGWEFRIEQDWSGDKAPVTTASLVRDVSAADADKALNADRTWVLWTGRWPAAHAWTGAKPQRGAGFLPGGDVPQLISLKAILDAAATCALRRRGVAGGRLR